MLGNGKKVVGRNGGVRKKEDTHVIPRRQVTRSGLDKLLKSKDAGLDPGLHGIQMFGGQPRDGDAPSPCGVWAVCFLDCEFVSVRAASVLTPHFPSDN